MRHDIDLYKKTFIVVVFLLLAFLGFETLKRGSPVYQKESLMSHLVEFGNTYIKNKEDKQLYDFYVKKIREIVDKNVK